MGAVMSNAGENNSNSSEVQKIAWTKPVLSVMPMSVIADKGPASNESGSKQFRSSLS